MQIIKQTASELVVKHKETSAQILIMLACLGFILLAPVVLPGLFRQISDDLSTITKLVLVSLFLVVVAGAFYISQCFEVYSFNRSLQRFVIERVTPFGTKQESGDLRRIKQINLESEESEYSLKEFVILILAPNDRRFRLPQRTFSFKPAQQKEFGVLLKTFLQIPLTVIQK